MRDKQTTTADYPSLSVVFILAPATGLVAAKMKSDDLILRLARENWAPDVNKKKRKAKTINEKVVSQIYKTGLHDESAVSTLEQLEYFEAYLWPYFDSKSTADHVASIAVMATYADNPWGKLLLCPRLWE
jgi:hypothetical protein